MWVGEDGVFSCSMHATSMQTTAGESNTSTSARGALKVRSPERKVRTYRNALLGVAGLLLLSLSGNLASTGDCALQPSSCSTL